MNKTFQFNIQSLPGSSLMFGTMRSEKKTAQETDAQYEERTWQQKVRVNDDGNPVLPGFGLKNALESAARRLGMKLTGKQTFTKLFVQGIICQGPFPLSDHAGTLLTLDDVKPTPLSVPSDGKRGSGKRVTRIFPETPLWATTVEITVLDGRITEEILRAHLTEAGMYIGFGSMRVENGGMNGRFQVID